MDFDKIIHIVVATAFEEGAIPTAMTFHMTPAARQQAKTLLDQSNQQHREFGGYAEGTAQGGMITVEEFVMEVQGDSTHVRIPWADDERTVAGWHSHPEQYAESGMVPETDEEGFPAPSPDDMTSFDDAAGQGHLSIIIGNDRIIVYKGRQQLHSEEL